MVLYAQLHNALFNTVGPIPRVERMLEEAVLMAKGHSDVDAQLIPTWGLFGSRLTQGRYGAMHGYALQFMELAQRSNDGYQIAMGRRMLGLANFRLGNFAAAYELNFKRSNPWAQAVPA